MFEKNYTNQFWGFPDYLLNIPEPTFPTLPPPDGKYRSQRQGRRTKNGKAMDWKRRKQIRERHAMSR